MTNQDKLIESISKIISSHRNYEFQSYSEITEELERMKESKNFVDRLDRFFLCGDDNYIEFCSAMSILMETKDRCYENILVGAYVNSDIKCEITRFLMSAGKSANSFAVCIASAVLRTYPESVVDAAIIASEILSDKFDDTEYEDAA